MTESALIMVRSDTGTRAVSVEEIAREVVACFPKLDVHAQRLSLTLYRLLARGEPVSEASIAQAAHIPLGHVAATLAGWPGIYHGDDGRIVGYWGLALGTMPHVLHCDGRTLYAWCAWDTLFLPELLGQPARVTSTDPVSGASLELEVTSDGTQVRGAHDVWMSYLIPTAAMGKTIVSSFCHYIHFFESERSGRKFVSTQNGTFLLNLHDAVHLARLKNKFQYPDTCDPWEVQ